LIKVPHITRLTPTEIRTLLMSTTKSGLKYTCMGEEVLPQQPIG